MAHPTAAPSRVRSAAPWVAVVLAAAVVAVFVLGLVHVLHVRHGGHDQGLGPTVDQQAAVAAAGTEAANLQTFHRASFDADFARALAGATGSVRSDLASKKSQVLSGLQNSKVDSVAQVQQSAFESASGKNVVALVTTNLFQVNDQGTSSIGTPQRLEITMVKSGSQWLAGGIKSVGIE